MQVFRLAAIAAAFFLAAGTASAQTATAAAASPGASAPRGGPGGMGMGKCCGREDTSGWSMMSRQERQEHRTKMRSMTDYAECKAYMDQHHQQMVERAKDKGRSVPAQPRRDACVGLKR